MEKEKKFLFKRMTLKLKLGYSVELSRGFCLEKDARLKIFLLCKHHFLFVLSQHKIYSP
jgi:hypothetical protein